MSESIVNHPLFDIRYTQKEEESYLKKWLMVPEVLYWYPMSNEKEVDEFVRNWIGYYRFSCSITATYENTPCGIGTLFLMPYRKVLHLCMIYLIVDPRYQRRGIGSSLLKNLKHLGKNYFHKESMHLEIFEGCPVVPVLQRLGFKKIVRQENFVKQDEKYLARELYEVIL